MWLSGKHKIKSLLSGVKGVRHSQHHHWPIAEFAAQARFPISHLLCSASSPTLKWSPGMEENYLPLTVSVPGISEPPHKVCSPDISLQELTLS